MEWTWHEQLELIMQCGGLGLVLGIAYDTLAVWQRFYRWSRFCVFVADCAFGLFAALVTFFFSLATMDGRMHPLLFVGAAIGALVERGIGKMYRCALYRLLMFLRYVFRFVFGKIRAMAVLCRRFGVWICEKLQKTFGKLKKMRKKSCNPPI